jgi:16S rRNA (uracil1498-N3)-methyltransferase
VVGGDRAATGTGGVIEADWAATARSAVAHVFVVDIEAPEVTAEDAHHLTRVLRARDGEVVSLADGAGAWRRGVVAGGAVEATGEVLRPPPARPTITIVMAVAKGDRPEWAVQKLTELGVDRIVPLVTARSVVRWDEARAARHLTRWRLVARQAAMQSRALRLPVIDEPVGFAELVAGDRTGLVLAEPGGGAPDLTRPTVLIGPEGGWTPEELAVGFPHVGLLPTVLRTETAAVVAATLLLALRHATAPPGSSLPPGY